MHPWRPIHADDREEYLAMATAFYNTDAVIKPVPRAHLEATFDELMRADTYASAQICETEDGIAGYALFATTFSQEAGGKVLWVEELYIKDTFRGQGLGRAFFGSLLASLPADIKRVRLEAERANTNAVQLYRSFGFDFLEYDQMVLDR